MSDKLGTVRYATQQYQFLSGETSASASPSTLKMIDVEAQRIITEQYERAQTLLKDHRAALERLTRQLLKTETVDGTAVKQALTTTGTQPNNDNHAVDPVIPNEEYLFRLRNGSEEKQ